MINVTQLLNISVGGCVLPLVKVTDFNINIQFNLTLLILTGHDAECHEFVESIQRRLIPTREPLMTVVRQMPQLQQELQ